MKLRDVILLFGRCYINILFTSLVITNKQLQLSKSAFAPLTILFFSCESFFHNHRRIHLYKGALRREKCIAHINIKPIHLLAKSPWRFCECLFCHLSESERRRSSFEGVGGSLLSAVRAFSTLRLHYLTSSPCLLTVTLMEPEWKGQRPQQKHQPNLIVF